MTQRKPERHPRRGSENRRRSRQVAVRLTPLEDAAVAEITRRSGRSKAGLLHEAFLAYVATGAFPPPAAQVRAWLRGHGWEAGPPGPAGAIWHGGPDGARVGVPDDDDDGPATWGSVERIAGYERHLVADVALEMLAISEEEEDEREQH